MSRYRSQRNYGCRVHDAYAYFGMRTVVLENELVRISLLVDKGTEIFEYLYKPKDIDFIWLSAHGVQNPNGDLTTSPDPASAFIDYYIGGWQEVLPNGGAASVYEGAAYGQHGEVANLIWDCDIVEDTPSCIAVRFAARTKKAPFLLTKTLTLTGGSPSLSITEQLDNLSNVPLRYMWGHHLAFGKPFLAPGCSIILPERVKIITEAPGSKVCAPGRARRGAVYDWPYGPDGRGLEIDFSILPEAGTASEMMYLSGFAEQAWYRLENEKLGMGIKVDWDGASMPYLWYWQEYGAATGYPWYGMHYNIGLEPFSSYPTLGLGEAVRNHSAGTIGPGARKQFRMETRPYELSRHN